MQLLQMPLAQPPVWQTWQARPPVPHASVVSPAAQAPPTQQPLGQLVPSQTHAPSRQRWPAEQAGPAPHAQAPVAEQASATSGAQAVQAAPAVPQVAIVGALQKPPAQQPVGHELASHAPGASVWQSAEQPSPASALPSSHCSMPGRIVLSPQTAGAPSVSDAFVSLPRWMTIACCSEATIAAPARPSTRRSTVFPASSAGSRTTAVSLPLPRGRGGLGRVPGAKAWARSAVPEIASVDTFNAASN